MRAGQTARARVLLDENPELTNMREGSAGTALHLAARFGHRETAELLLDRGAQIEAVCGAIGSTPLKYAVFFAQVEMVRFLLQRGADLDNCGENSRTPLELALSATEPMFRRMGTPGSDLDYARIAAILRSRSSRREA